MLLLLTSIALAAPLTCERLLQLRTAGATDHILLDRIERDGVDWVALDCLRASGFSDAVLAAALDHSAGAPKPEPPASTEVAPAAFDLPPSAPPSEVATGLAREGMTFYRDGDTPSAKAKFTEALKVNPGDKVATRALAFLANPVSGTRAGGWKLYASTDEFTGKRNVYASLSASNTIPGVAQMIRPTLFARCSADGDLDLFVAVSGAIVNSDYHEIYDATGRERVDDGEVQTLTFGIGDDRDAVFHPRDLQAIRALATAKTSYMVELPTYGRGDQVVKFTTTGSSEVLPLVLGACGLGI